MVIGPTVITASECDTFKGRKRARTIRMRLTSAQVESSRRIVDGPNPNRGKHLRFGIDRSKRNDGDLDQRRHLSVNFHTASIADHEIK